MADVKRICADLNDEHEELDALVRDLDDAEWDTPTPAEAWSVRDQISHLTFFDEAAELAARDQDGFQRRLEIALQDLDAYMNEPLETGRSLPPHEVLGRWRAARRQMLRTFETLDPALRIPWYGPPMSPASFVTARLMETWAHGQDVADALGVDRIPTERLRHVAHIGVRTRPNSYAARGIDLPSGEVRVELTGPGGDLWTWNEGGRDAVKGSARDFSLVVTQRRHPDDTDLVIEGPLATEWMSIAQSFAGPPGAGRKPGQFRKASN
ncbi:MAG: TIGR03084 family metal-binding protein [Actinomycetota bacterium]|nr:TIGR03084 family metal-binding protein [Actinomycetota bacterium]